MRLSIAYILNFFKLLVVYVVIYTMIFQPLAQSFYAIEASSYELIDLEKESDKNEEHTDTDEKVKLQFINFYGIDLQYVTNNTISSSIASEGDFVLEIPIPPPDML